MQLGLQPRGIARRSTRILGRLGQRRIQEYSSGTGAALEEHGLHKKKNTDPPITLAPISSKKKYWKLLSYYVLDILKAVAVEGALNPPLYVDGPFRCFRIPPLGL